jgi:hypothetical protein
MTNVEHDKGYNMWKKSIPKLDVLLEFHGLLLQVGDNSEEFHYQ